MVKILLRSYAMSDNDMFNESKTKVKLAKEDYISLQKIEPNLTMEQLDKLDIDIDDCMDDYSSLESKAAISIATEKVNDLMDYCKGELQIFYFHVHHAFPGNSIPAIELGERGVDEARKSPEKMIRQISLITSVHNKPEYKEKLNARLPANFMQDLAASKVELNKAMVEQSVAKSCQPAQTEERIAKYNAVWDFTRNISEIGKIAFRDSYAKVQQYKLYDTPSPKTETSPAKDALRSATNDQNSAEGDTTPEE